MRLEEKMDRGNSVLRSSISIFIRELDKFFPRDGCRSDDIEPDPGKIFSSRGII